MGRLWPKDYLNQIINSDCIDVMREMPDKCVDLVLTDPPYGIGEAAGKNLSRSKAFGSKSFGNKNTLRRVIPSKDYGNKSWDNAIPSKEVFQQIQRISKNQIIFGGNYFVEHLYNSPCWLVWDKDNSGDFADCELAWTSFKTAVRKFKYRWNGMLQEDMKNKEKRIHPTQKPVALFEWIMRLYSNPGDIILDPFLGSGTTVAACINLERQYIGIEISPDYVFAAEQRIKKATEQRRMFL